MTSKNSNNHEELSATSKYNLNNLWSGPRCACAAQAKQQLVKLRPAAAGEVREVEVLPVSSYGICVATIFNVFPPKKSLVQNLSHDFLFENHCLCSHYHCYSHYAC